ncbi:MAG: hypothetical protein M1823_001547 [Watsoniomyces obsoletus]|nr:MAG: hypothetical protein M1823_001547 [Watsoniomyces obsoletus]
MAGYPPPMPYQTFMDPDRNTTYVVVPVQNGIVQSPQAPAAFSDWANIQAQQMVAQQILGYQQVIAQQAQTHQVHAPSMDAPQMMMPGTIPLQSFQPISAMPPPVPMTPTRQNSIQGYGMMSPQVATPSSAFGRLNLGRHSQPHTPSHSRNQSLDQSAYRVSKNGSPTKGSPQKSTVKKVPRTATKERPQPTSPRKKRSPVKKNSISPAKEAAIQQAVLPSPPATQRLSSIDPMDVSPSFPELAPLDTATTMAPEMSRDLSSQSTYYSPLAGFDLDLSPDMDFHPSPESSYFDEAFAAISSTTTPEEDVLQTPPMSFESSPDHGLLDDPFMAQSSLTTAFDSKLVESLTHAIAGNSQPPSTAESHASNSVGNSQPTSTVESHASNTVDTSNTSVDTSNPSVDTNAAIDIATAIPTTTTPASSSSSSSAAASPAKVTTDVEINPTAIMVETGITEAEIEQYIQSPPPNTIDGKWRCTFPECRRRGDDFGRKENCRSHIQTHLGDRPYQCSQCHKRFVRPHDLKRHANIHSPKKKYLCPCGRDFVRQDALTRHRQRGMCCGALEGAVRREGGRRGRPPKARSGEEVVVREGDRATQPQQQPQQQQQYQYHDAGAGVGGPGPGGSDFVLFPGPLDSGLDEIVQFYG